MGEDDGRPADSHRGVCLLVDGTDALFRVYPALRLAQVDGRPFYGLRGELRLQVDPLGPLEGLLDQLGGLLLPVLDVKVAGVFGAETVT